MAQRSFILGHELAHVFVELLPTEVSLLLRTKIMDLYTSGIDEEATEAANIQKTELSRIRKSDPLMKECLCDALSLASVVNAGVPWPSALLSASDAVQILQIIAVCDFRVRVKNNKRRRAFP